MHVHVCVCVRTVRDTNESYLDILIILGLFKCSLLYEHGISAIDDLCSVKRQVQVCVMS